MTWGEKGSWLKVMELWASIKCSGITSVWPHLICFESDEEWLQDQQGVNDKNPECQTKELELNSVCNKSLSEGFYFIFLLLRFFFFFRIPDIYQVSQHFILLIILFTFIFGCAGSSLLRGLFSSCHVWASHRCGAWVLGHRGAVVVTPRL